MNEYLSMKSKIVSNMKTGLVNNQRRNKGFRIKLTNTQKEQLTHFLSYTLPACKFSYTKDLSNECQEKKKTK